MKNVCVPSDEVCTKYSSRNGVRVARCGRRQSEPTVKNQRTHLNRPNNPRLPSKAPDEQSTEGEPPRVECALVDLVREQPNGVDDALPLALHDGCLLLRFHVQVWRRAPAVAVVRGGGVLRRLESVQRHREVRCIRSSLVVRRCRELEGHVKSRVWWWWWWWWSEGKTRWELA